LNAWIHSQSLTLLTIACKLNKKLIKCFKLMKKQFILCFNFLWKIQQIIKLANYQLFVLQLQTDLDLRWLKNRDFKSQLLSIILFHQWLKFCRRFIKKSKVFHQKDFQDLIRRSLEFYHQFWIQNQKSQWLYLSTLFNHIKQLCQQFELLTESKECISQNNLLKSFSLLYQL